MAGLVVADPWLRLGLLELGALLTIPLVWQSARTRSAKLVYLAVVLISACLLVASDLLMERGQADWARALLITSVCVKLAAVPLFFWLLSLADELPAVVLGLIIAVVDMAAFGEFCRLRASISESVHAAGPVARRGRGHFVPRRSADALAAQPQTAAGSLHG